MKLELRRNDILLRLPSFTEEITRTTTTGLSVATLKSQTYNPISGEVIHYSLGCTNVVNGDIVFFPIFTFSNAKERCFGDDNPEYDGYRPITHYAWKENGVWYMIIRETDLYFILNEGEIIPVNNYTLARPIKKEEPYSNISATGLLCVDIKKERHKPNEAIIFRSSHKLLKEGMVVQTLRHCDITIEEQLNCPILPEDFFIIETKNIISCIKQ
jgi:hypothetical protein